MSNSKYNWHILEVVHNRADSHTTAVVTRTLETSSQLPVLPTGSSHFVHPEVTRS